MLKRLSSATKRRHVVAAIGIVRIDAGNGDELPPSTALMASSEDMIASQLVVGRAKEIARVVDLLVGRRPASCVPIDGEAHARPRPPGASARPTPVEMMPWCSRPSLLLHELAEAFDRILGRGLSSSITSSTLRPASRRRGEALAGPLRGGGCRSRRGRRQCPSGGARMPMRKRLVLRDRGRRELTRGQ